MTKSKSTVNLHDRYIKVGVPKVVWVVGRLLETADPIPHVVLYQEGPSNRQITLSVTGLQDTSLYKRVEVNP